MRIYSARTEISLLILCIFFFNAPFFLLSSLFKFDRAVISYESILCLFILSRSVLIGGVFLFFSWICDLLTFTANIYFLGNPSQVISNLAFAFELKFDKKISIIIFLLFALMLATLKLLRKASGLVKPIGLRYYFLVFLAIMALDVFNGTSFFSIEKRIQMPLNVAGSPILNLTRSLYSHDSDRLESLANGQSVLDYIDVKNWVSKNQNRSVIFSIVESYGLPKDTSVRDHIRASLVNEYVKANYEIKEISVPFSGATTSGELRSLCKVNASYSALVSLNANNFSKLDDCLPNQLKTMGLDTIGIHGFSGSMFARRDWWHKVGLVDAYFREDLIEKKYQLCGNVFQGVCDREVIRYGSEIAKNKASFIYLLTLETHLPVPFRAPDNVLKEKCENANFEDDVCSLLKGVTEVMHGINIAMQELPAPPLVIIVGDHAPPFSSPKKRDLFSSSNVPAWILIPNR